MENKPLGFGAIERTPDPRDWQIGSFTTPTVLPETYLPSWNAPIKNQGHQPSCGANSGAELKELFDGLDLSEEYLWKKIKQIDGFPPSQGTNMLYIMKVLKENGLCVSAMLPNNVSVPVDEYASSTLLTPEMDTEAANHKISGYAFTFSPTFDQIKEAIYNFKGVILLMRIGAEFWTPSWHEKDILPLKTTYPISSGHFVLAYGFDKDYIYFVNHWGQAWGRVGTGYFGTEYLSRVVEIGTAVDLKDGTFKFLKNLKQGDTGLDVKMLQGRLGLDEDGVFGPITKRHVEDFQRKNKLMDDGLVGPLTRAVLNK